MPATTPAASSAPRGPDEEALPRPVGVDPDDSLTLTDYWRARLAQHTGDWYCGIRLQKLPEDLRVYEHLLWASRPDVVVELGTHRGGSTLWFRDRLLTLARYRPEVRPLVVGVGLDTSWAAEGLSSRDASWRDDVALVDGDVTDPDLPARVEAVVRARVGDDARCLVVEDSAHTRATTAAALAGFAAFVPPGGFVVVEDGVVDVAALTAPGMGDGGVLPAVEEWLASPPGRDFTRRRDLELYGVTSSPSGWLQRTGTQGPSTFAHRS